MQSLFHIFTSSTAACENFSSLLVHGLIFLFCVGPGPVLVLCLFAPHEVDVQLWLGELLVVFFSFSVWFWCLLFFWCFRACTMLMS